jgi:DNA-binding MarR family transcriptional regulator
VRVRRPAADVRATLLRLSGRGRSLVTAAIEIGDAVEHDLARDLGDDAAAHIRAGLERLAHDPPWAGAAPARARRVW